MAKLDPNSNMVPLGNAPEGWEDMFEADFYQGGDCHNAIHAATLDEVLQWLKAHNFTLNDDGSFSGTIDGSKFFVLIWRHGDVVGAITIFKVWQNI